MKSQLTRPEGAGFVYRHARAGISDFAVLLGLSALGLAFTGFMLGNAVSGFIDGDVERGVTASLFFAVGATITLNCVALTARWFK